MTLELKSMENLVHAPIHDNVVRFGKNAMNVRTIDFVNHCCSFDLRRYGKYTKKVNGELVKGEFYRKFKRRMSLLIIEKKKIVLL